MAVSEAAAYVRPSQADLDKCVHCGLCLNACPTYRELGVEMDSPRGRIYQINAVANGAAVTPEYVRHINLCLACRGCETACPSGVPYGRIVEAARAQLEGRKSGSFLRHSIKKLALNFLIGTPAGLQIAGAALYLYERSGLRRAVKSGTFFGLPKRLTNLEVLTPRAEVPFFFGQYGRVLPAVGERRFRVVFLAGCVANVAFARMNEATIRVLQKNGCEVVIPVNQQCCGALHLHSGLHSEAAQYARRNIDAVAEAGPCDAIITNAAGCGSTLKEYEQILASDAVYAQRAREFSSRMKDVTEFLAGIDLNRDFKPVNAVVTYQDSCHLLHGQKLREAPRVLLRSIPNLTFREMPAADVCCGSAGIYNIVENEMAMQILDSKMKNAASTKASLLVTANPGCMLQLRAGVELHGTKQRVMHLVELLDEAYN